ncbi:MAG: M28 family peptidase [Planctomycetaceae bacterium]
MDADLSRLTAHVAELARAPRLVGSAALEDARRYVSRHFEEAGWQVEPHPFAATTEFGWRLEGRNLIARHPALRGDGDAWFCVGAHVDSIPDCVGADDNASAVAALLEIARLLPERWPAAARLNVELVAFDLEENGMLGGAEHARLSRAGNVDLRGMVSLEMLGYCSHEPNSQILPRSLVGMYPDVGNFIAVIGNQNSPPLIERFAEGMRRAEGLPVETLEVPENGNLLQATRLSDHSPFWDAGYAALMITDTSFLRNPHYHTPGDTPDTLDMDFLQRVTQGCLEGVRNVVGEGL